MGALFAKKKVVWVPNNEKLEDKCSDPEGWQAVETFKGWKVCNDGHLLARAMAKCSSCGSIDLSYCGLGDNEAREIAKAIAENMKIKHEGDPRQGTYKKINLSNNAIHHEGIKAICEVLKPPQRTTFGLEEIDFSNNYAGVEGAIACGDLLKSNRILRKVSLRWNNIGNKGMIALLKSMAIHHRESCLDISGNSFEFDQDVDEWAQATGLVKKMLGPGNCDGDGEGVIVGWSTTGIADVKSV